MNVEKIQLPDGTCITVEGGNAGSTAQLIANELRASVQNTQSDQFVHVGNPAQPLPIFGATVEPLPLPSMDEPPKQEESKRPFLDYHTIPVLTGNSVEPLPLPSTF